MNNQLIFYKALINSQIFFVIGWINFTFLFFYYRSWWCILDVIFFFWCGYLRLLFSNTPFHSLAVALRDIYEKIYKSVDAKSTPPNAWLWSLIESCANKKDIDLLFQTLQNLRRFVSHLVAFQFIHVLYFFVILHYFPLLLFFKIYIECWIQRLSALRINENFNSHLCQRVAEACARVGAFDYGIIKIPHCHPLFL